MFKKDVRDPGLKKDHPLSVMKCSQCWPFTLEISHLLLLQRPEIIGRKQVHGAMDQENISNFQLVPEKTKKKPNINRYIILESSPKIACGGTFAISASSLILQSKWRLCSHSYIQDSLLSTAWALTPEIMI